MSVKLERRATLVAAIAAPAALYAASKAIPAAVDLLYSFGCTADDVMYITGGLLVSAWSAAFVTLHRHNTKVAEARKAKANP